MPSRIDPETMNVDNLPGIWSPVQWELDETERLIELDNQALASLIWVVDIPEAMLRLLLNENEIERANKPPPGYDPNLQGEWEDELLTFQFKRSFELVRVEREQDHLYVEYKIEDLGSWMIEIFPDKVTIHRR